MAIPIDQRKTFNLIVEAAKAGRLALMECSSKSDSSPAYLICGVSYTRGDEKPYEFIPLASLFTENPYNTYNPPEEASS